MLINTEMNEKNCTLTLEGSIDTLSSRELAQAVNGVAQGCGKLIFDMTKVDYISSGGLRAVVLASRLVGRGTGVRTVPQALKTRGK